MFDKASYLSETNKHRAQYMLAFPDSKAFAIDGPNDSDAWIKSDTRILFLLKETYGKKGEICQCMDSLNYNVKDFYSNTTNRNIAKLAYGITTGKPTAGVTAKNLSPYYSNSSTIEIKKSSGKKTSHDLTVYKHALFSKDFIRWQIITLNPDVIICCGSIVHKFLVNEVYSTRGNADISSIGGTIVVKSKHPSAPGYSVDKYVKAIREFAQNNQQEN